MKIKFQVGTALALPIAVLLIGGCSRDADEVAAPSAAGPSSATPATPASPAPAASSSAPVAADEPPGRGPVTATAPGGPPARPDLPINDLRPSWVVGTVTRGGSGPCYGIKGEDGIDYAAYSATSHKLTKGQRIRTKLTPGATPKSCGSGKSVTMGGLQIAD